MERQHYLVVSNNNRNRVLETALAARLTTSSSSGSMRSTATWGTERAMKDVGRGLAAALAQ